MTEGGGPEPGGPPPVSWDEARELVAVVLLVVAVMVVAAPGIRVAGTGSPFGFGGNVSEVLRNINATTGMLLRGSAVLVCTVQPVDVVPRLRQTITVVAALIAALGLVAVLIELTSPAADQSQAVWIRLELVLSRLGPGTLLAGAAAWLARRVVPFPE